MKRSWIVLVVVGQILLLGIMAGGREWILHTGKVVTLRTAPLDPTDPMRGSYVRFNFELSRVPAELCRDGLKSWVAQNDYKQRRHFRDRVVYAQLEPTAWGGVELAGLSDVRPAGGPFLRGRVTDVSNSHVTVRYGVEALFIGKDAAQGMETAQLTTKAGAPLDVHVAVGANGTAVIKGYEWEPLGLTIAPIRAPVEGVEEFTRRPRTELVGLMATLHNYSDHDVAIVDLPDGFSFKVVANDTVFESRHFVPANPSDAGLPAPTAATVFVLPPGNSRTVHIDLRDRRWWMRDSTVANAPAVPIRKIEASGFPSFRIVYTPPSIATIRSLPHGNLIGAAPLRSRAFGSELTAD